MPLCLRKQRLACEGLDLYLYIHALVPTRWRCYLMQKYKSHRKFILMRMCFTEQEITEVSKIVRLIVSMAQLE